MILFARKAMKLLFLFVIFGVSRTFSLRGKLAENRISMFAHVLLCGRQL